MITIILGEDTAESRRKFIEIKNNHVERGNRIVELTKETLPQIQTWLLESQSLFEDKQIFFAENILSKKEQRQLIMPFDSQSHDNEIIIWEELVEERVAKFFFKHAVIIASKLPTTIFSFLDNIYPSNIDSTLSSFQLLCEKIDVHMTLFMLQKRMRELILVAGGQIPVKKLASWQLVRLKNQARKWTNIDRLLDFYDGLYRIEMYEKTGTNYYNIRQALDILFVYYL